MLVGRLRLSLLEHAVAFREDDLAILHDRDAERRDSPVFGGARGVLVEGVPVRRLRMQWACNANEGKREQQIPRCARDDAGAFRDESHRPAPTIDTCTYDGASNER